MPGSMLVPRTTDVREYQLAMAKHDKAVVIALQAEGGIHQFSFPAVMGWQGTTRFVQQLATSSIQFGLPVLLLGSNLVEAAHSLAVPTSATGLIHHTPPVPNLTRHHGTRSTNNPGEWLRRTVDTRMPGVFSWKNVPIATTVDQRQ